MTLLGTLLNYIQAAWSLTGSLGTALVQFREGWWDHDFPDAPQITVSDQTTVNSWRARTDATHVHMVEQNRNLYLINCWSRPPTGSIGTQELENVKNMCIEAARIFRQGFPLYGGSMGPLRIAHPNGTGSPRHEWVGEEQVPRMCRYELSLQAMEVLT